MQFFLSFFSFFVLLLFISFKRISFFKNSKAKKSPNFGFKTEKSIKWKW